MFTISPNFQFSSPVLVQFKYMTCLVFVLLQLGFGKFSAYFPTKVISGGHLFTFVLPCH